ncbi:MAG: DUF488 domain-containing protein [Candidatus Pelagadaptatus aseana]|uniref:DUF488 domain-containing protein n=1 Tax=Candidatus Pelagadaptatus aseana TaxID=3120508 RepID=UPI0039B25F81
MIYTIGYATKPLPDFIAQLNKYQITAVCDVRSVPFSKRFYDYHQDAIKRSLHEAGIRYVYLGEELGPRSKDPAHYDDCNQVQFDRLMQSDHFMEGLERLRQGQEKGFTMALMCAEKDPATCHRSLLIGYAAKRLFNEELQHITHNGDLETQEALETRLKTLHGLEQDLFTPESELRFQAYQQQLKKTSYIKPDANSIHAQQRLK